MTSSQPISQPLCAAALELTELVALSENLQDLIAELSPRADAEALRRAQDADLLSQRLGGLTVFVLNLAALAPDDCRVRVEAAVEGVTLADQAARLSGAASAAPPPSGDVMLFGE